MTETFRPTRRSAPLAPYRAVLVVDAERYSRTTSLHQRFLSGMIRSVLADSFSHAGLAEAWRTASFPQHTGDGYLVGLPPEYLPFLIDPLLDSIQHVLEGVQDELAAHDRALRLRLRASIEVGPLHDSGGADDLDGVGHAMTQAHRLLDSPPVRAGLSTSEPDITLVSAIISRRVYEDAVLGGYVGLNPRHFRPVQADIPAKEYRDEGYLYIPRPSPASGTAGAEARPEQPPQDGPAAGAGKPRPGTGPSGPSGTPDRAAASADRGGTVNRTGSVSGRSIQAGTVNGDLHGGDRVDNRYRRGGVGDISGDVGTVITGAHGPVHTGRGDQHNNPERPARPRRRADSPDTTDPAEREDSR
ncbi:hypothetical protein LG943_05845 [Streptomonospora sp. S1-112]|uniref:Guanylate cyclase domain-containing protein n=1 Tax=Streptomonospora mangrovi TaxID=2883123 RepID=A0A9X3NKQ1_9ACTN|nr:hypothetical protein [Streptomonospora mangrovi]MDA0563851.1 hypothetical protein [Streptomonospora mangrovi]